VRNLKFILFIHIIAVIKLKKMTWSENVQEHAWNEKYIQILVGNPLLRRLRYIQKII
jgi:hypothetical protein